MTDNFWTDIQPLLPQLVLAVSCMAFLLIGAWRGDKSARLISQLSQWVVIPFLLLLNVLTPADSTPVFSFEGLALTSKFTQFVNWALLLTLMIMLDIHRQYMKADKIEKFEYPILLMLAALGMMVMVSSDNLMTFYIGLELQSLSLYILVAIRRDKGKEGEAAVKYFTLGALSSALILFGASYIYGFVGTTSFEAIASGLKGETAIPLMIYLSVALIIAGMCFKISAVPFHMWAPDVYEGSPMVVTAFLATMAKVAAFTVLIRLLAGPFLPFLESWGMIIAIISVLSVILGAYGALYQKNIKRLLAYSSISHMGYALMGIIPGTAEAVDSALTYIVIYLITVVATFVCFLNLRKRGLLVERINDLTSLARTYPVMAACVTVMMFSLAGIPPMAGFFAKFSVFRSAVMGGYYPLALIGVLASVVGAVYYLRIIKIMYFDKPITEDASLAFDRQIGFASKIIIGAGVGITLFFILYPSALIHPIEVASRALFIN